MSNYNSTLQSNNTGLQAILNTINELPEAGGKTEWNTFWDIFQDNGNRTDYKYEFRRGWNDTNFKPKYDIIVKNNCDNLFQDCKITDLKQILLDCGISFDMSQSYGCYYFGSYSKLTHVPEMGSTSQYCSSQHAFRQCTDLISVDKMTLPRYDTVGKCDCVWAFQNCTSLTEIRFSENIAPTNLNFQYSPLSYDSLMSLINNLADVTGDTSTTNFAITLGADNLAKLTDAEKAIATQKGWTLA